MFCFICVLVVLLVYLVCLVLLCLDVVVAKFVFTLVWFVLVVEFPNCDVCLLLLFILFDWLFYCVNSGVWFNLFVCLFID